MFAKRFSKQREMPAPKSEEQAVLVYMDGSCQPDEVYALEDQLERVIQDGRLGEFDGNEFGPDETTLFMYGPDAERLFAGIEPVLRAHPLCHGARAVIREGQPGTEARQVLLA